MAVKSISQGDGGGFGVVAEWPSKFENRVRAKFSPSSCSESEDEGVKGQKFYSHATFYVYL